MTTKSNIKPLFDNVLVKPLKPEEKTAGGIYLPETSKEKPQMVEVMAVGDGAVDQRRQGRPRLSRCVDSGAKPGTRKAIRRH